MSQWQAKDQHDAWAFLTLSDQSNLQFEPHCWWSSKLHPGVSGCSLLELDVMSLVMSTGSMLNSAWTPREAPELLNRANRLSCLGLLTNLLQLITSLWRHGYRPVFVHITLWPLKWSGSWPWKAGWSSPISTQFALYIASNWDEVNICRVFWHKIAWLCWTKTLKIHQVQQTHTTGWVTQKWKPHKGFQLVWMWGQQISSLFFNTNHYVGDTGPCGNILQPLVYESSPGGKS